MASKKSRVVARGTPHQWAYANILAKEKGFKTGVGAALKTADLSIAKPKTFKAGVKQMTTLITRLKKL